MFDSASAGKGISAAAVAVLVDRGLLDYQAPVARYWPEFSVAGKAEATVGQVMSHSVGLPWIEPDVDVDELLDQRAMAARLASQPPAWQPGTQTAYHGWTCGVLVAEIVRRATGRGADAVLAEEIATPLGISGALMFAAPETVVKATAYDGGWAAMIASLPADLPLFRAVPRKALAAWPT